jgi:hypothetical protein
MRLELMVVLTIQYTWWYDSVMNNTLKNSPGTYFAFAAFIAFLATVWISAWYLDNKRPQDLQQREGYIERIEHTNSPKNGHWVHIYLRSDNYSLVYNEDLSRKAPALNALQIGDWIVARVKQDTLGRNQGLLWELKRGDETLLSYEQMAAFRIEEGQGLPQLASGAMVISGLLVIIGIVLRRRLGVKYSANVPVAPITHANDSSSINPNLQAPSIVKSPLPPSLGLAMQAYGLFAYILVAWKLGLQLSAIEIILESVAGYLLARWWIHKIESRSILPHPVLIIAGFLLLHLCLACLIDRRLAAWLLWSFFKLKQMMPSLSITLPFLEIFFDLLIAVSFGIFMLLTFFQVGPRSGGTGEYYPRYEKWAKYFRWIGPLSIVTFVVSIIINAHVLPSYRSTNGGSIQVKPSVPVTGGNRDKPIDPDTGVSASCDFVKVEAHQEPAVLRPSLFRFPQF